MLKYKPKEFWNMLKQKDTSDVEISIAKFTNFTRDIFHNKDIPPDTYHPLSNPTDHHISPHELSDILRVKYNAAKSRGLSKLPP
jgi:hypothetical protein